MGDRVDDVLDAHHGADTVTASAVVVEQNRSVVGLTTWIRAAAGAASAHGRQLQVLAPSHSRLTYALEMLLADTGGRWVVRTGTDTFFDGLSGEALTWTRDAFAPHRRRKGPPRTAAVPGSGDLEIHVSSIQRDSPELRLGATLVRVSRALTGHDPLGWGVAEPTTEPWDELTLTAALRHGAGTANLVVSAAEAVGQLHATTAQDDVHELVRMTGRPAGHVDIHTVEHLARTVSPSARYMVVTAHPSRLYGLRASRPTSPPLPYAVLVGHQVVARSGGRAHLRGLPLAPTVVETSYGPAAWYRLDNGPGSPAGMFADVMAHFDGLRLGPDFPPDADGSPR